MKLLFLGDIFTERDHNLKPEADYIFGNLEGPLGGTKVFPAKRMPDGKRWALKSVPEYIKKLNLSAVSLANNHIWDYGEEGFSKTVKLLFDWNWESTGADFNDDIDENGNHQCPAKSFLGDDYSVYLFAYSWHEWPMTTSLYLDGAGAQDIRRERMKRDITNNPYLPYDNKKKIIIVSLHWGFENEILPMPSQQRLAHDIIDWGADIVVGTHPHVIQGIEPYKHGLIMYSLGNFLFQYKDKKSPFPVESIGIHVNSDNFHDYKVQVFKGDKKDISRRLNLYGRQLRSPDYANIWKEKRLRKELPGTAWGYTYNDTFDKF